MSRTAKSPQVIWQASFNEYQLVPFSNDKSAGLRYQSLANPATWWHNPVNPDSLRLTKFAYQMLAKADVKMWKFKLVKQIMPKTYIQLERHFTAPYFIINSTNIAVFGEQESMWLALHTNDLQQYLDSQS